MKCDFPKNENVCKRCKAGKHHCVVEGRKPRSAPNKREYLLAQIRQKDAIIESLLKQLHNPYLATPLSIEAYRMATPSTDHHRQNVIAWLDRLQSSVRTPGGRSGTSDLRTAYRLGAARNAIAEDDESDGAEEHDGAEVDGELDAREQHESDGPPGSAHTLVDPELEAGAYPGLPDDAVPIGMLANLAISNSKDAVNMGKKSAEPKREGDEEEEVGVANKQYFLPGPSHDLDQRKTLIAKTSPPDILVHGLVTPEDVDKLFEIFYARVNPFISLLDPKIHTPASTFSRCPFLFTVVCAISSRYSEKPEVYPIAMHFAKSAAANALIDGWKTVELCQAYILMSIYAVPARRWEEDRSWLYTGLAIRIATDLNLHQYSPKKASNEMEEREMLNRTRVWLICFNLDKSTATQFGKPSTVREDYIVRNSMTWYKKSKYNHPYDIHLICYQSLMRILNKFHHTIFSNADSPHGLNQVRSPSIDFHALTMEHEALLVAYHEEWKERFANDSDPNDEACSFRSKLLPFYTNYARLVTFSFGFQKAFHNGLRPEDEVFFTKCLEAAKAVVTVFVDSLCPTGYIRFAPDSYFMFASFAAAFLLKLLRTECSLFITDGLENEIYDVINGLIQTIGSPQIAIDDRHTPKLYSRFLAGLLAKHRYDGAARGRSHQQPPPAQQTHQGSSSAAHQGQQQQQQQQRPSPPNHTSSQGSQDVRGRERPQGMTLDTSSLANAPVYQVEAPYMFGTNAMAVPTESMDFAFDTMRPSGTEDVLAVMKAIDNPAWWSTMMMPGYVFISVVHR
ncbi:hypothetical protein FA95DRAFT_1490742 [Auriscalpium vulgare]|uniref:Uncharacterized protein n=1 Tax=Auriscalpium vulgare TaxID=40419 RepID=A0ACB8RWQ3_9AGAM|nr:hypothetical protein FA95DRAFT_1490742 [Auriscalpium vulgare]